MELDAKIRAQQEQESQQREQESQQQDARFLRASEQTQRTLPVAAFRRLRRPQPPSYPPPPKAVDEDDQVEEDEQAEEAEEAVEGDEQATIDGDELRGRAAATLAEEEEPDGDELWAAVEQQYQYAELTTKQELQDAVDQDADDGDDDDDFAAPDPVSLANMVKTYRSWATDGVVDGGTDRLVQSLYSQLAAGQVRPGPRPECAGPQKRGTKRRGGRLVQMRRLKKLLEDIGVE